MSPLTAIRAAWGSALLLSPNAVLRSLPHDRIDRRTLMFVRVLGSRHLMQVAIDSRHGSRGSILAGAAIDAIHASTMLTLARLAPDRRRLALTNAATAAMFTLAGVGRAFTA
ncbi:MAG: hypothetical protein ACRDKL_08650 [Solirubrobacteraceae bacterium]